MAVTDLTGTKWQIKNDFTASKGYGVFHLIGSVSYISKSTGELISTPFYDVQNNFGIGYQRYPNLSIANVYYYRRGQTAAGFVETNSAYVSDVCINITGGNDVTNSRLIAWLEANATQIIEPPVLPTDTVTIEYNGSVIAALKAGQSATLPCKDTLMHTDVVVSVPDGMGAGEVVEEWDGSYTITNAVSLISFTVAGTSYEAEDGMTWEQWCRSTYNFDGYYVLVNMVVTQGSMASGGEQVAFNNIQVFPTDVIMEYEYQWLDYGGSN